MKQMDEIDIERKKNEYMRDAMNAFEVYEKNKKNKIKRPMRLKHNAGDGGDYKRSYISDYAIAY